jgi:(p)ppGpp synthase/HD superfamily hydrolase
MTVYTAQMQRAIRFMLKTHEVYQKQKRKGKDIPYISHPLTVALILARAGAHEELVIAGILHDTIEDSIPEKKVTREMLAERFGAQVAALVQSVTEAEKSVPWNARKAEALAHIDTFDHDAVLLKSADIIANNAEVLEDYAVEGENTFARFSEGKEKTLGHALAVIEKLLSTWPESPLAGDLQGLKERLAGL